MMRDTPRVFIGSVVFLLEGPLDDRVVDALLVEVASVPGVRACEHDAATGALVVTAGTPMDRADVVAAIARLGCRIRP